MEMFQCPSCNIKLEIKDVASHCEIEIQSLRKMRASLMTSKLVTDEAQESRIEQRKPYNIFQRVQKNRQIRNRQRSRKSATQPVSAKTMCPICNKNFLPNEIQRHADKCLRRSTALLNGIQENSSDDDDTGEAGEEYEEYEWAGQKRIRASSLLEGGYASIGIGQSVVNHDEDDDEDLNVDEDDTRVYGPAQCDEVDVIPTKTERTNNHEGSGAYEDVTSYMRSLITGYVKATTQETPVEDKALSSSATLSNECSLNCQPSSSSTSTSISASSTSPHVVESLKIKLRQYENHLSTKYKCLICLDDYRKPAISVACWHVHCEECWLRALGSRKLCPQCNLITSPKDLRRIYL